MSTRPVTISPELVLQRNPELLPEPGEPAAFRLTEDPSRLLDLSEDAAGLLGQLAAPRRLDEVLPSPAPEELAAVGELVALRALLVIDDPARPHEPRTCRAFAARELGGPRPRPRHRRYLPTELLRAAGLPEPLPRIASAIAAAGDALGHEAVPDTSLPWERQWNPYSGQWYLADDGEPQRPSTRWIGEDRMWAASVLFRTVHEVTHAQVASVALAGLLGGLDLDGVDELHRTAEVLAIIVGDVELTAESEESGYLEALWPPAAHTSNSNVSSPAVGLRALGLRTSDERAAFLRRLLLDLDDPLPPGSRGAAGDVAQGLHFVLHQHAYATKIARRIEPAWRKSYWAAPEIRAFVREFVPPRPARVLAADGAREIASIADLWACWREVTLDWRPPPEPWARHAAARHAVQRLALKVAELAQCARSERLLLAASARGALSDALDAERRELSALFERVAAPPGEASVSPGGLAEEVAARRVRLIEALTEIGQTDTWELAHPSLTGDAQDDEGVDLSIEPAAMSPARVRRSVRYAARELDQFLALRGLDPAAAQLLGEAAPLLALTRSAAGRATEPGLIEAMRGWLTRLIRSRALRQAYPLRWAESRSFAEPCVGFLYQ